VISSPSSDKSPSADPITSSGSIYQVLPARIDMNAHQVKIGDVGTVSVERNKGAIVRKEHILGRLVSPSPSIPLMLCSLILLAVLLASQAMALNFTSRTGSTVDWVGRGRNGQQE